MVGRSVDHDLPEARGRDRRAGADGRRALASDRIRRHLLRPAQRRDPRLLRPGRRRPQRGHAGDLRHDPAQPAARSRSTASRSRSARRPMPSRPASSMCRRSAAGRAWCIAHADLPEHLAAVARPHRRKPASCGSAEEFALARALCRAARPARRVAEPGRSARCRAATSRRS